LVYFLKSRLIAKSIDFLEEDEPCFNNLELYVIPFLTGFFVTHTSIITSNFSKIFYNISSSNYRTFSYHHHM